MRAQMTILAVVVAVGASFSPANAEPLLTSADLRSAYSSKDPRGFAEFLFGNAWSVMGVSGVRFDPHNNKEDAWVVAQGSINSPKDFERLNRVSCALAHVALENMGNKALEMGLTKASATSVVSAVYPLYLNAKSLSDRCAAVLRAMEDFSPRHPD